MEEVRATAAWVASRSSHVIVDSAGIEKAVENIREIPRIEWDFEGIHYFDNGPLTVQYLFVLDALNFCFWPGLLLFTLKNSFAVCFSLCLLFGCQCWFC
uniref:Queuosine 5'-phosphate N-glycosylase/hydrolase n=1 Tax=Manihot esculenta TaxID=3983 RepID=A0A2C9UXF9_MANES